LRDDDDVEVWTSGHELVATIPGRLISHLVELHLASVVMQQEIRDLLRRPPVSLPARAIVAKRDARKLQDARRNPRKRNTT
jgi:hypothetical protein